MTDVKLQAAARKMSPYKTSIISFAITALMNGGVLSDAAEGKVVVPGHRIAVAVGTHVGLLISVRSAVEMANTLNHN